VFGPVIVGEHVRLEPPRSEHAPTYIRWLADPEVIKYLLRRNPPSLKQEEEWLERMAISETDVVWAIVLPEASQPIGTIGLHKLDWRHRHAHSGTLIAMAALDNLVKGASGQAVQNMNVMMGLPEDLGLWTPGLYP